MQNSFCRFGRFALSCAFVSAVSLFAAQPLPAGKANFSLTLGNLDNASYSVVRLANYVFNSANGTVGATIWSWRSDVEDPKQAVNSHTCTFDGHTKTCTQYVPYGWMGKPGGIWFHRDGNYTYNTATGPSASRGSTSGPA